MIEQGIEIRAVRLQSPCLFYPIILQTVMEGDTVMYESEGHKGSSDVEELIGWKVDKTYSLTVWWCK